MRGPPDLSDFLAALRADGLPVGPAELTRLHHAFGTAPGLDREGLRGFLACLLAKTPEQRACFDRRFDTWCPERPADWGADTGPRTVADPGPGPGPGLGSGPKPDPGPARRPVPAAFDRPEPPRPARWPRVAAGLAGLALAGVLLVAVQEARRPPTPADPPAPRPVAEAVPLPALPEGTDRLPANPVPRVWYWQARVIGFLAPDRLAAEALALIALAAGALGAWLWARYRRRNPPPPRLAPSAGGPAWVPLSPIRGSDTALLHPRERRALVWNIGRFATEDLTRRLDEAATVTATARAAGISSPRYRHARFPREVWLWQDEHASDPALDRLAAELADCLGRAGLRVRRGSFAGTPERVWWRHDDQVEPSRLEGHRAHAMVALLTDGRGLARALGSPLEQGRTTRLLRQLRLWPHLILVDFGPPGRLARLVRPAGLRVCTPPDLAAWLGGRAVSGAAVPAPEPHGDLRLWAAACALGNPDGGLIGSGGLIGGGDGIDQAAAQRLRHHLGLALDPWRVRDLERLGARPAERRALIDWLLRAGPLDRRRVPVGTSPAARAIRWWRLRYRHASQARGGGQNPLIPWDRTPARRRLDLERALLALYRAPALAAGRLQALAAAEPRLRDEIGARLAVLCAADQWPGAADGGAVIRLTWCLAEQAPRVQAALVGLGLGARLEPLLESRPGPGPGPRPGAGGRARAPGLRPPPRLALALGLCGGLGLAAAGAALDRWLWPPGLVVTAADPQDDHPAVRDQTLRLTDPRTGRVVLGQGRGPVVGQFPAALRVPGAGVRVEWTWGPGASDNNPVPLLRQDGAGGGAGGEALILRAGRLPQPIRPCVPGWPARALAVIASAPGSAAARRLAVRLLDSGTADQVLLTPDPAADLGAFTGSDPLLNANTRLLIIRPAGPPAPGERGPGLPAPPAVPVDAPVAAWAEVSADLGPLAAWLAFPGTRDLAEAPVQIDSSRGAMPWHGGPARTLDPASGITWVHLCPGTFTMGSDPATDPDSREDERPPHTVVLSAFDIALTETTNAQYRRVQPGYEADQPGDLPVVRLDWQQASDFCRAVGGDLPTEAQWEYAARGGSLSRWSFGEDAGRAGDYAWYSGNSGYEAKTVGGKGANPLGLYDMHGNVYEWVRDWYENSYSGERQTDPSGAASGVWRVVRGGSFFVPPGNLRPAVRVVDRPDGRDEDLGLRCVRSRARQH